MAGEHRRVVAVVVLLAGPELQADLHAEGCGGCHTLADAGASGTSRPNLDELAPDASTVQSGAGSMPSFDLAASELDALAEYVAGVAGR